MKFSYKYYLLFLGMVFLWTGCDDAIDHSLTEPLPEKPQMEITSVPDDPNRFVVRDLSQGNLSRVWSFTGGIPEKSSKQMDTVFYTKKGEYEIELHIASMTGGGTAFNTSRVTVEEDVAGCQFEFLNENCAPKCWRLSPDAESILVGPIPFSGEWYTSPNIADTQADDQWCFYEDGTYEYNNNGSSFSACQGFIEVMDYPIPADLSFSYEPGSGVDGLNRLNLDGIWMGVEDSGPSYDIVEVSETKMVMVAPIKPCDGSASNGFFTLTFLSVE